MDTGQINKVSLPDRVPFGESPIKTAPEAEVKGHEGAWLEGAGGFMDSVDYHRMAEFLGVDRMDRISSQVAEKISLLTEWAQVKTKSRDTLDHKIMIKQLIDDLGYQTVGTPLVDRLTRWVRLDLDKQRVEKEMLLLKDRKEKYGGEAPLANTAG